MRLYETINGEARPVSGGAGGGPLNIDDALSNSSENPVQNKVITAALGEKVDFTQYADNSTFGIIKYGNVLEKEKNLTDLLYNSPINASTTYRVNVNKSPSEINYFRVGLSLGTTNVPNVHIDSISVSYTITNYQEQEITRAFIDPPVDYFNSFENFIGKNDFQYMVKVIAITVTITANEYIGDQPHPPLTVALYATSDKTMEYTDKTTVREMEGATNNANGKSGIIPAPLSGDQNKFLKGDGTWANIITRSADYLTDLRFKNLGSSFTSVQQTALAAEDFSDFYNGDYWVINGITWRIVDNTGIFRRRGDTNFDKPSLVIMPDTNLIGAEAFLIDNANDSGHGYANCAYRTRTDGKGRAQCKTIIENAFGASHIASHREFMSTARTSADGTTSYAWQDADVELPTEMNIYGGNVWSKSSVGGSGGHNVGDRWGQFMLFRLAPYMAINRNQNYWLRDISGSSYFAYMCYDGHAAYGSPSTPSYGVRPLFILI